MNRQERIAAKLEAIFSPDHLEIIDESHKHAGHAGAKPEGETHFRIEISSPTFKGQTHVQAHRQINESLKDEFASGLHALSIHLKKN